MELLPHSQLCLYDVSVYVVAIKEDGDLMSQTGLGREKQQRHVQGIAHPVSQCGPTDVNNIQNSAFGCKRVL